MEKKNEDCKPKCIVCDKMFSTKKQQMKHNRINHLKPEQFEFIEGDKSFREEWKLNAHTKVHKKYPL